MKKHLFSIYFLIFSFLQFSAYAQRTCFTPNHKTGYCVHVESCQLLNAILNNNARNSLENRYLASSGCSTKEDEGVFKVCCEKPDASAIKGICGKEMVNGPFDPTGEVQIHQHPWLGLIEYNNSKLANTATLISKRYLITIGQAVNDIAKLLLGNATSVRLGDFNLKTNPDCGMSESGKVECADPHVTIPIEKVITHPEKFEFKNNLALVKLSRDVVFSDFIKPICLTTSDPSIDLDSEFITTGWITGNSFQARGAVERQRKVQKRVIQIENSLCLNKITQSKLKISDMENQMCFNRGSNWYGCSSDVGGPLLIYRNDHYELVGIVNKLVCRNVTGLPDMYTNIYPYLNWIQETIKS